MSDRGADPDQPTTEAHAPSEVSYDEQRYPARPKRLRPRGRLRGLFSRPKTERSGKASGENALYVSWLAEQSMLADRLLNEIPGVTNVTPRGALYCFPRLDPAVYAIDDDQQFVIDLLRAKKILVTHGTGFNWFEPDHFRLVTLPDEEVLTEAIGRIGEFLATRRR